MKTIFTAVVLFLILIVFTAGYTIVLHELPNQSNNWFSSSGACVLCHSTSDFALRDGRGNDVSPVSRWRSTMLANASKDPFWKAKVRHEGLENPAHKDALENVCTRCHAPMGMLNAFSSNDGPYTMDRLQNDALGKDGISCTLCHQIDDISLPDFSGNFGINSAREIYGPYENPITAQMVTNSGYTPVYSEVINESRLCGSCHSLFTHSVDMNGELTGETFVEQALYHEWENSMYGEGNISCQSCHMPRIDEPVKISSRPGFIAAREPFGIHDFTGGNVFMLQVLKENHELLQLHSGVEFLDQSIERTRKLLSEQTIDLSIEAIFFSRDSVFVEVELKNLAGHKFPTGFPSRRAWLEFLVTDSRDTLFHSGKPGSAALSYRGNEIFEPHYALINDDRQVQIYEFVMGDTEGKVTTILEKAYVSLKDNRIVPKGFSQTHTNYDTVQVVGNAINDSSYFSGEGVESVIYAFPLSLIGTPALIEVSLHYETAPESWLTEMFEYAEISSEIQLFKDIYGQSDRTPVIVASVSEPVFATTVPERGENDFRLYPNPSSGEIWLEGVSNDVTFTVYSLEGRQLKTGIIREESMAIDLGLPSGNYLFLVQSGGAVLTTQLVIVDF